VPPDARVESAPVMFPARHRLPSPPSGEIRSQKSGIKAIADSYRVYLARPEAGGVATQVGWMYASSVGRPRLTIMFGTFSVKDPIALSISEIRTHTADFRIRWEARYRRREERKDGRLREESEAEVCNGHFSNGAR
jgi:hypothetical protein